MADNASYCVTVLGPNGYVDFDAEDRTEAVSIADALTEAADEGHTIKVEQTVE